MSDTTETETETDTNTNTDEPSKAELHDRVRKLESTVEKLMPSRRDALKLGAAGIAGAAGLGATTQSADASTGSAGQIGDSANRPDLFTDEIDANTVAINELSAELAKNSNQSIPSSTNTVVNWGIQRLDTGLFSYDATTDTVTVLSDGDYLVDAATQFVSIQNDQDFIALKVLVNGGIEHEMNKRVSGTSNQAVHLSVLLKDLSANDDIQFRVRTATSNIVEGVEERTFAHIARLG